ncbi:MAG: DUF3141 domain-containing protein, partial [Acetobacteraceae bacterium]|nr:DUF3141 domain-containing protein [Acetobacteraceae bacterium]
MTFIAPFQGRGFPAGGAPTWSRAAAPAAPSDSLLASAVEYAVDAGQRAVLFWDAMRQAGNAFVEHEAAGFPPVLFFGWDMVV